MSKFLSNTKELFISSALELKVIRNVVICGMMAALAVVLGYVTSIDLGPYVRIGFSGIPNRIVEFLFGPVVGTVFGGMLDVLKFIIKPSGTFFFGFTFNAMLAGFIYGSIFYKKNISVVRILIAEFLVKLIVNCVLNTLWLSVLYGKGFFVILPPRILKNLIMWPIDSAIIYVSFTLVNRLKKQLNLF